MNVEIINTGSELLLGRVLNRHQQWLCRELNDRGYRVTRQVAVDDSADAIGVAVREALERADLVITTGGLGPTSDDLTLATVAGLFGWELEEDVEVLRRIEAWFRGRNRTMPASTRRQAMVPSGAKVLHNANGTAPGLILRAPAGAERASEESGWLVMLPGPPRELHPMFREQVIPWLERIRPLDVPYASGTLRTMGIGESAVEERIGVPLAGLAEAGLMVGYCSRPGEVDVRLEARGEAAARIVAAAEHTVRRLIAPYIYGCGEDKLEEAVVGLLSQRGERLAVAESCTGGRLANRITDVPGASEVFVGGWVTYSNELKRQMLSVAETTLREHGAVSEPTAREMAEGARRHAGVDYGIALTGIAGPGGGTGPKPVGTVYIALADHAATEVIHRLNAYDRETFKQVTTQQALELLRQRLRA